MSNKAIICRCEDVTLSDLQHTISIGYKTIEEVKRYTGLGTGPCEGKECMVHAARLCAAALGGDESLVQPFTSRPPVQPAPLAIFARADEDER
jgi:NAD(P)H-nitrite reductase large subunit